MRDYTARKIVSNPIGKVARNVAKASGKSIEQVTREARKLLTKTNKRERQRRKNVS